VVVEKREHACEAELIRKSADYVILNMYKAEVTSRRPLSRLRGRGGEGGGVRGSGLRKRKTRKVGQDFCFPVGFKGIQNTFFKGVRSRC